ncbi:shikimate dehydrogenase [Dermatophilaceae bacterium Sec6.4]
MLSRQRAAVVGSPVAHSLSPVLHRAAYVALGLSQWTFELHRLEPEELPAFVAGLNEQWRGLSVTMPLKEAALALADDASEVARQTGAANTLVHDGDRWQAHNTDVAGICSALVDAGVRRAAGGSALVLGSGATARSALAALKELRITDVTLAVRDRARDQTLRQAADMGITATVISLADAPAATVSAAVVVSTLPAGAADPVAAAMKDLSDDRGCPPGVLLDVVYAGWPTPLGLAAQRVGFRVVPGIEMLIHQGAEQVRLMTGLPAPLAAMQTAGRAAQGIPAS